jgi:HAMP domain-containing protein
MPIKDPAKRREYFRELMRRRRAGKPSKAAEIVALRAEIKRLREELEAARSAGRGQ